MVMQAMHSGRGSKVIKGVFFALLVLATAGLVLTDVGGFFRGGVGSNDVAKVGDETITIVEFDRTARRALARLNMTPQQAYQMGYMDQLLNSEIQRSLFKQIADDQGVKVSRDEVAKQIDSMISPMVQDGQDKQQVLNDVLRGQGFTENEFVSNVSAEAASGILRKALENKFIGQNDALAIDLYNYQKEARDIEFLTFVNTDVTDIEEPSDEQLEQLYESMKPSFSIPENRDITVGVLNIDSLEKTIEITDEQIKAIYDEEIESYKVPEQRIFRQAIVSEQQQAQEILQAVKDGSSLKEAVKKVTDDEIGFIDDQAFEKDGLPEDISNIVFVDAEASANKTYEPIQSPLGWHVLQLVEINPPRTKPFTEVKDGLRQELLANELADQRYDLIAEVEDLLASGAGLDEVKNTVPFEQIEFEGVTSQGAFASTHHPLDQFGEDQQIITDLAFEFYEGETSPITELSDDRLVFVKINKVNPRSFKPFEDLKDDLKSRWIKDQQRLNNQNNVSDLLNTAVTEGKTLKQLSEETNKNIKTMDNIDRSGTLSLPLTSKSLPIIFNSDANELIIFDIENGYAIGHITSIDFPDSPEEAKQDITNIKDNLEKTSPNESLGVYFENMRDDYSVKVNNSVLDRVYGSANTQ